MSTFTTRQFKAGNSQAVRIPTEMAFPAKTELIVKREGNKIIVEPKENSLNNLSKIFAALKPYFTAKRLDFEENKRDW